ncbi:hypothetical protein D3C80_1094750 [compost metagenome]
MRHFQRTRGATLAAVHCCHCPLGAVLDTGNHLLDLCRRLLGTVGEGAYLVSHHGKPTSCLSGPCRLDGGVQCQQVGLPGNCTNHVQHPADLVGVAGQLLDLNRCAGHIRYQMLNGCQRLVDLVAAIAGGLVSAFGSISSADRVVRHFLDCRSHLVHRRGGLVDFCTLLMQAAAGVFSDGVQFFRGRGQLVGRRGDLANGIAQAALHPAQGAQ